MKPTEQPSRLAASVPLSPIAASSHSRGSLAWDAEAAAYLFETDVAQYRVVLGPGDEQNGLLFIEGRAGLPFANRPWLPLLRDAGMLLREPEGGVLPAGATHQRCELSELQHSIRGRTVCLRISESVNGATLRRKLELRLTGRALEIAVEATGGKPLEGFCGFSLGQIGPDDARRVPIPGLPEPLLVLEPDGFLGAFADRSGDASSYPPGGAFYRPDLNGVSRAIRETFYVTLSTEPLDPLPSLQRPPAPFRRDLERRIALDFFSEAPYAEDERILRLLHHYGLHDVLLIYRNWQQFGYERRDPLHYPANPERGTNEEFRQMLHTAADNGWLPALREEYSTMAVDSPYFSKQVIASWWDGKPRMGRGGRPSITAHRMLEFARLEATKIRHNYPTRAAFVDGHTAWNPEACYRQVDAVPGSPAGTEGRAVQHVGAVLDFLRETYDGPVIGASGAGPSRFDTFAAGMAEGVIRAVDGGADAPLIVDYELQEVRPSLIGIGAGTYRQFCGLATGERVDISRMDTDAYRITEIALGHTGYVGNYRMKPGPHGPAFPGGASVAAVREYYLLRSLQELAFDAPVRAVRYRFGPRMLSLREALLGNHDLRQAQLRIEYENGLTVWINRHRRDVWTVDASGERWELPPNGFVALSPQDRFIAYSALVAGQRADYCRSEAYTFLDTRSPQPRSLEGITTDGSVALLHSEVADRRDIVLVGARALTLDEDEYRLGERADARFSHVSESELEVTVMDSETGKPVQVSFPAFAPAWKSNQVEVLELHEGRWVPSRNAVAQTRNGLQMGRLRPGTSYRIIAPVTAPSRERRG